MQQQLPWILLRNVYERLNEQDQQKVLEATRAIEKHGITKEVKKQILFLFDKEILNPVFAPQFKWAIRDTIDHSRYQVRETLERKVS